MKLTTQGFAKCLRGIRQDMGLNQTDLAILAQTSQANISRYEAGAHLPDLVQFVKICNALNVDPRTLLME